MLKITYHRQNSKFSAIYSFVRTISSKHSAILNDSSYSELQDICDSSDTIKKKLSVCYSLHDCSSLLRCIPTQSYQEYLTKKKKEITVTTQVCNRPTLKRNRVVTAE